MNSRRRALAAIAVGLAALLVAVIVAFTESKPRLAATNNVRDPIFAAVVPRGAVLCQTGELMPADAASVQIRVGTYGKPMPPLTVTATGPGAAPITGSVSGGGPQGRVPIPVPRTEKSLGGRRVCLRNGGRSRIAIGGEAIPNPATIGGRPADGRVRLEWYRPGKEDWFAMAPTVAHRFGYGNAPWMGPWTLWLAALLFLGALAAAVAVVLRQAER